MNSEKSPSPWADPGAHGEHLSVEQFPTFIIGHLSNALQRDVTVGYLVDFGLSPPQWRILAALAAYTPIAFSDLVKLSMSDKALVSRTIHALIELGLAKSAADPGHSRKLVCTITAKGRRLYQKVLPVAQQEQLKLLAHLDPGERVALYSALVKLRTALSETPS